MKYLLDTNQVVDYLRRYGPTVDRLDGLESEGLAISIITLAELYEGVANATDPAAAEQVVDRFLTDVTIMNVDRETSWIFGRMRATLKSLGTPMSDLDLLIASTAMAYGLELITADKAFRRVEGLQLLFVS